MIAGLSKDKVLPLIGRLVRTKTARPEDTSCDGTSAETSTGHLKKCLTAWDLTSLGVGSCVGTGMYLVAGMVARNTAGPGVIFSFCFAALASLLSGVCYAEFGVRVPNTSGSAYMYSYVTVGEFVAFVVGWNMILEYLIGSAAGACAISACLNAMFGGAIHDSIRNSFGTFVGHTPDFLAGLITCLMTGLMVAGVRKSLAFNNFLNVVNFVVWCFIMFAALFFIDFSNWNTEGGFLPYGWSGVLSGAATCFYAFIGFDIIATTGEEAENPTRDIPKAITWSLIIVLTAYITSSVVVTLVVPYFEVDRGAGLVEMFAQRGSPGCQYIVAIGALAGLVVSMFGSMFPMPRVVYAMAKDGLIFRALSRVWPITETPAMATVMLGGATAFVATIMGLDVLVEMMSIGTLMAYTLVSTCVLLLRYQPGNKTVVDMLPESVRSACATPTREYPKPVGQPMNANPFINNTIVTMKRSNRVMSPDSDDEDGFTGMGMGHRFPGVAAQWKNRQDLYGSMQEESLEEEEDLFQQPSYWDLKRRQIGYMFPFLMQNPGPATDSTGTYVIRLTGALYGFALLFDLVAVRGQDALGEGSVVLTLISLGCLVGIVVTVFLIGKQPQAKCDLKFKAPAVPIVPAIAITVNIYLILKLSHLTLIRFIVWMTLGMFMYFGYGIKESNLEPGCEERIELKVPTQMGRGLGDTNKAKTGASAPPPQPPRPPKPIIPGSPVMNPLTNPFLNMNTNITTSLTEAVTSATGNGTVVTTTVQRAAPMGKPAWANFE
ncbi:probable cationic amino acid transporter [Galendromus occidentalis]|uniref:Probable cationic amino acid transporter n=1 Tax=Galendromus occidentalis TaxID=34638 RepID=A0AAJ7WI56_9ACAR|nr:probable cationic amino acid transporter [Galendromus occidentalis]